MPPARPGKKLAQIQRAACNVSANEISVHRFEAGGRENAPGEDEIAESGGKTLNLSFDSRKHIFLRAVGDMAVSPGCVLARRRASRIKQTGLGK